MHQPSDNATVSKPSSVSFPRIDTAYWRRRATEIRELAEQMRYDGPRREMFRVAAECAALAERGEQPK